MANFVYSDDKVTRQDVHPERKTKVTITEFVPRDIPALDDECWDKDPNFAHEVLVLAVGKCKRTNEGKLVRDLFLKKVRGDKAPDGRNYPYMKIGAIFNDTHQDKTSGDTKQWHAVQRQGEPQQEEAPKTEQPSAEEATENVESI